MQYFRPDFHFQISIFCATDLSARWPSSHECELSYIFFILIALDGTFEIRVWSVFFSKQMRLSQ
jgi:hypothetical protein